MNPDNDEKRKVYERARVDTLTEAVIQIATGTRP
jgi:hypothetical protein